MKRVKPENIAQRELIEKMDAVYPDGLIAQYAEDSTGDHGDTLAQFIVMESLEVTAGIPAHNVQTTAHQYLQRSAQELQAVVDALAGPADAWGAGRTAAKMLDALRAALSALNTAPRFNVGKTTSYNIAGQVERAIAQAEKAGI